MKILPDSCIIKEDRREGMRVSKKVFCSGKRGGAGMCWHVQRSSDHENSTRTYQDPEKLKPDNLKRES